MINSSSIVAVASRIQERANILSAERDTLDSLKQTCNQVNFSLDSQEIESNSVRKKLLSTVRVRHGVELEILQQKDMARFLKQDIHNTKEVETIDLKKEIVRLRENQSRIFETIFAPHIVQMQVHQRSVKKKLERQLGKRRRRETSLDAFALNRQKYGDEAIALEREKERLKLEVKKMRNTEKKEDEEIAGLALQITATLNKVVIHYYFCYVSLGQHSFLTINCLLIFLLYSEKIIETCPRRGKGYE